MFLDRSKAPEFKVPEDFELLPPSEFKLSNGAKFFFIPTPGLDAVKIDIICKGQRASLPLELSLIPSFTLQMLQEGTKLKNAGEIAEFFDFYASEVHPILTFAHEGLGLLTTRKHLSTVLDIFISLFTEATFPQDMLEKRHSQRKLSIQLERERTASRASQIFSKCLFGAFHPYGVEITEEHVDAAVREPLVSYYESMLWQHLEIFVTGNLDSTEVDKLCILFGQLPNRQVSESILLPGINTLLAVTEPKEKSVQSSIRIGNWSIPKTHPDFIGLTVFNTLLGGYFGSRLVKNIREDKGHTYGIHSTLAEIGDSNYWVIAADVQKAFYPEVIKEIYHEIKILTEVKIDGDELEVLRNYLIGQMLKQFSTSFDLIDRFKAVHHSGMDFGYFTEKLAYLKRFTSEDIRSIGQKYFSKPPFIEVIVG
ncbi:putative Zn-dependent peptidase [Algoriphagus ratkowskyi]|uniref:Insulinase family protein n=1 Tax=Algoriphagus ratkowskyi TaxID=57028 RepID=A0A2W7RFP2_9BACT|nr:pitrilysin family protein [Algoriphagus ratkowskyi]PZX59254.1 putative Zn-dependent peptidase [Algoriphagus ratkowskyi]TXD77470.1 insulinase family protein [Algoriphagus ratkowskyi]